MDVPDYIALASATAATAAAIWAGIQGRAAKRQAASAEHQVELSKKQLSAMERANEIAERAREDERNSQKLKLDIAVTLGQEGGDKPAWWLTANIENNSLVPANIQAIAVVFADESRHEQGAWSGEIKLSRHLNYVVRLPGELLPGHRCTYKFGEYTDRLTPDYTDFRWSNVKRVEVRANNLIFVSPDDHWIEQLRRIRSSTDNNRPHQPKSP